jgi:hypothetical protein
MAEVERAVTVLPEPPATVDQLGQMLPQIVVAVALTQIRLAEIMAVQAVPES